jgi:hypothetical protein
MRFKNTDLTVSELVLQSVDDFPPAGGEIS